jgi:hypothetical protein
LASKAIRVLLSGFSSVLNQSSLASSLDIQKV